MPDHEKDKEKEKDKPAAQTHHGAQGNAPDPTSSPVTGSPAKAPAPLTGAAAIAPGTAPQPSDEEAAQHFYGEPLVGFDPSEIQGSLIVIEGMDGSGRSTQIALLQEWLESEGFAVQTSGLRRSNLVGRDIDQLLAKNAVTRLTLSLMYATPWFLPTVSSSP